MKKILWIWLFLACNSTSIETQKAAFEGSQKQGSGYRFSLFQNADSTYAYRIIKGKDVFIRQETIPSQPGTAGFKDSIMAKRTAGLVVEKLQKGMWPPTISSHEIDSILNMQ